MNHYRVTREQDDTLEEWRIEAKDMTDAMITLLDDEGYQIELIPELDLKLYYQRSSRYKGVKLGDSNLSFQNYGCFTFCLAYLLKKDPLEVMELLKKNHAYSGALMISTEAAKVLGLELLKGDDPKISGKMNDINYMPKFETIKEVKLGKSQHFVVRLLDSRGNRAIFDPWTGEVLPVNHYPFVSYRLFKTK